MYNSVFMIGIGLAVVGLMLALVRFVIVLTELRLAKFKLYLLKKGNIQIWFGGRLYKKICRDKSKRRKNYKTISIILDKLSQYLVDIGLSVIGIQAVYIYIRVIITMISYQFGLNNNFVHYITLTLTLTLISYFPEKMIFWFYRGFGKIMSKFWSSDTTIIHKKGLEKSERLILILQPKLWVYFISIIFTLLNSLEKVSGTSLIQIKAWIEIKPIIFEAVFTMIVIDRFVKQFKSDKDKIIKYINEYKN